ncbi:CoA transferase [Microvirga sp. KLBC 81]|uniref:CaiB/BaiF CoA transferase family protein n=1 Tax=Microvirga sp. KLBC 81 TaxID=1862707 RepID=UPI000D50C6B5|nr:CaiB/BaiF CoA-transferase family protein [Microvirga sp. KLBC 81]PVE24936.1 CoA transferase [Microvirga sp. KLBC 81]
MQTQTSPSTSLGEGPLAGLRIIDLTLAMAGPLSTQRLADMGADVIKIEAPGRPDFTRNSPMGDVLLGGETTPYLTLNRNKKSLAVDLKTQAGREVLYRLVETADAIVQNFRPGVAERLGISYTHLKPLKDDIVYVSISGYGDSGPMVERPGQDLLVQSFSGLTWNAGVAGGLPHPSPVYMIDVMASHLASEGVLAGILQRDRLGRGSEVKVSLLGAALEVQIQEISTYLTTGRECPRNNVPYASNWMEPPYGIYPTADGHIAIAQSSLAAVAKVLGADELARLAGEKPQDPDDREGINAWRDRIYPVVAERLATWRTDDAVRAFFEAGVWSGPVNDYAAVKAHPQFEGFFVTYDHPRAGAITTTAPSIRFSTAPEPQITGAPALGEHTGEILASLGYGPDDIRHLQATGAVA